MVSVRFCGFLWSFQEFPGLTSFNVCIRNRRDYARTTLGTKCGFFSRLWIWRPGLTMTHWVSWATKVFGYIAQFILRPWLFDAELLGASRTVYTSTIGNSPFVDIGASVRIHNRNNTPTTVFVRSIGVRLAHGMEAGLDRAVMIRHCTPTLDSSPFLRLPSNPVPKSLGRW